MAVNYQRIGERMKTLRELKGLTVGNLVDKTNFTPKSILLAENGKASLSLEFLLSICTALDVTPNDLLLGEYVTTDSSILEAEALFNDLILRLNEAKSQDSDSSKTLIKDTDLTIQEIRRKLVDYKREENESSSTKRANYYK